MKKYVKIQDDTQSRQAAVSVSVTELRIGNLLMELTSDDVFLVTDRNIECCRPIPLLEEWLLNFGFPSIMNNGVFQNPNFLGNIYSRKGSFFFEYVFLKIEIKYVHQLQNLYFALTGSELQFCSIATNVLPFGSVAKKHTELLRLLQVRKAQNKL